MINTQIKPFNELTLESLYEIIALRIQVFSIEQQCFYQDLDFKDQQSMHVQMRDQGKLVGYARILDYDEIFISFGRFLIADSHRKLGLGKQLLSQIMDYLATHHPKQPIKITAQLYLKHFYQSYGFIIQGEPFDLEGIPHYLMVKPT